MDEDDYGKIILQRVKTAKTSVVGLPDTVVNHRRPWTYGTAYSLRQTQKSRHYKAQSRWQCRSTNPVE